MATGGNCSCLLPKTCSVLSSVVYVKFCLGVDLISAAAAIKKQPVVEEKAGEEDAIVIKSWRPSCIRSLPDCGLYFSGL